MTDFGSVYRGVDDGLVVMIVGRAKDEWRDFFLAVVLDHPGKGRDDIIHVPARSLADGDYWELLR